jgi:hypothetical protein
MYQEEREKCRKKRQIYLTFDFLKLNDFELTEVFFL